MPTCVGCSQGIDVSVAYCPRCGTPNPEGPTIPTPTGGGAPRPVVPESEIRSRLQAALGRDFVVEEPVGQGGFAAVYAVQDRKLSRRIAVKVLHPELTSSESTVRRFIREAEAAASLSHPHILPIFFVGEGQGLVYFGMPLVEGETLDQFLAGEKQPPEAEVVRIGAEIADALADAHARGIVHRDVKPANVLLQGPRRRVLVADFGIAKAATGSTGTLTGVGVVIGSPHYMSPEQAAGTGDVDRRSDIYSLGIVLWQMLAGRVPYDAPESQDVLMQHLTRPIPSLSELRPAVRPALARVVERCTAKKREERFQSVAEVADALRAAVSAELPAQAGPRRWPVRAGIAAVLTLALGITALVVSRLVRVTAAPRAAAGAADTGRTSAPVIAVLPFEVSGPGDSTQVARSAARLLTNALTTGFDVATVDVNRFLSLWTSERRTLTAPLDSNAAFAYRLGANQLVYGSSVAAGGQVRLAVDVYDTRDLGRLGHAEQTGNADSLFALMDRLAGAVAHVFCQRPAFNPRNLCFDVTARAAAPVAVTVAGPAPAASPTVDVLVTRSGTMGDVRPGSASPEVLTAALPLLQSASYVPARKGGRPVDSWAEVEIGVRSAESVVVAQAADTTAARPPAAAPHDAATDCASPSGGLLNPGGRCFDTRPAPRTPPMLPVPSSCGDQVGSPTVLVRVSAIGEVGMASIQERSGCEVFDAAATALVRDILFTPATKSGGPVAAWVRVLVRSAGPRTGGATSRAP